MKLLGLPKAGCTISFSGGFLVSTDKETRTSPGSLILHSAILRVIFFSLYVPVCIIFPLSCLWASLKKVWPHPLDTCFFIFKSTDKIPSVSSASYTASGLSASACELPLSPYQLCSPQLDPSVFPSLPWTGESKSGQNTLSTQYTLHSVHRNTLYNSSVVMRVG